MSSVRFTHISSPQNEPREIAREHSTEQSAHNKQTAQAMTERKAMGESDGLMFDLELHKQVQEKQIKVQVQPQAQAQEEPFAWGLFAAVLF
jgi:hypothetical protein